MCHSTLLLKRQWWTVVSLCYRWGVTECTWVAFDASSFFGWLLFATKTMMTKTVFPFGLHPHVPWMDGKGCDIGIAAGKEVTTALTLPVLQGRNGGFCIRRWWQRQKSSFMVTATHWHGRTDDSNDGGWYTTCRDGCAHPSSNDYVVVM